MPKSSAKPPANAASAAPEHISLIGLADRFIETHKNMPNRAFAFVLGAGASRSSGIKTAGEMVDDWIKLLFREAKGDAPGEPKAWATKATLRISKYDPSDPAASYSQLYKRMYIKDPDRGYAYLEDQMRTAEPSYGYSVLARIMDKTQHKVVVTTNFDNLVADSLSIYSLTYPLVCGHESLAGFISAHARRPLVVKVHRDLLLAPRSAPEDVADLPEDYKKALPELFRDYTPIVIGYGGNDGSLMAFLNSLEPKSLAGGVFWCYLQDGTRPSVEVNQFVAAQDGCLVPVPGFDETMMLLGDRLGYDVPDKFLVKRAADRAKRIVDQVETLRKRLIPTTARDDTQPTPQEVTGLSPATGTVTATAASDEGTVNTELAKAILNTMQRVDGERRWWQWDNLAKSEPDPAKRDQIYQDALQPLPRSAPLLGNYALFLKNIRKDYDKAEEYYKKALEAEPGHANNLGNYASLLLSLDRTDEGLRVLDQAISALNASAPEAVKAEVWMYAACHWLPNRWREALGKLKGLLITGKITTEDWDFSGVIAAAKKRDHPDAKWLDPLATVCAGKADPSTLAEWEAWAKA